LVGVAVAQVVAARTSAQTAADAAALAVAPVTFLGGDPPEEAARLAQANEARLLSFRCDVDRSWSVRIVRVEVAVAVDVILIGPRTVRAVAAAEFDPVAAFAG